jgi:hypothetical protein
MPRPLAGKSPFLKGDLGGFCFSRPANPRQG